MVSKGEEVLVALSEDGKEVRRNKALVKDSSAWERTLYVVSQKGGRGAASARSLINLLTRCVSLLLGYPLRLPHSCPLVPARTPHRKDSEPVRPSTTAKNNSRPFSSRTARSTP